MTDAIEQGGEPLDIDAVNGWIGRSEEATDMVTARIVQGLRAILQLAPADPQAGDAAPPGVHWCYLLTLLPKCDSLLPQLPSRPRAWAGCDTRFVDALRVGDLVTRRSTVASVDIKRGRSGDLLFVSVDHEYSTPRGVAVYDRQNFVYPAPVAPAPATGIAVPQRMQPGEHARIVAIDPVMLFRYSALSFNGFRSHFDAGYANLVEGYPGLMVHGPLQASLLIAYATELRGGSAPTRFSHRSLAMLYEGEISLNAAAGKGANTDGLDLWTASAGGAIGTRASATWAEV